MNFLLKIEQHYRSLWNKSFSAEYVVADNSPYRASNKRGGQCVVSVHSSGIFKLLRIDSRYDK